ncbi:MAG: alpha-glucuronidase [Alphaproteobacteria bacterium]|nr:alpha-glucuronidase [Alphaproteobacteria bacterium]
MLRNMILLAGLALGLIAGPARAEDGYDLWLRYRPVEAALQPSYAAATGELVVEGRSAVIDAAAGELERGIGAMLRRQFPAVSRVDRDGAIVIGTPASSPAIAALRLPLNQAGEQGYLIRSVRIGGHRATVIAANRDVGILYGAFRLLRLIQTRQPLDRLDLIDAPKVAIRMLDHWDDLDRHVERGYAGLSLWDWQTLPGWRAPRYLDYARANASIGINGAVLNNVNSNADILTPAFLAKVGALADLFRPWGIRVYLSARFSAPMEIGGLKTADPLDPLVRAWWKAKADEIYRYVPDFGGFLVKANSEGQPGPQSYGRSHADGANMLAAALAPHNGIVIWRAFVYSDTNAEDRAKQAYSEFQPLDGKFADNVVVQVKNGPIDFQPREPFSPLFGAMPRTALAMEMEITKEYLGFATHLVYLGTMWEEVLRADTYRKGPGSTVAKVIDGSLEGHRLTVMAGVANVGNDRNWTGSQFDQANWYAFGRLAWNPDLSAQDIAEEWVRQTFGNDPRLVLPVVGMMIGSRQAAVDYMTPLGLAHLMGTGHHYGPAPWVKELARPEWNPVYYHRADQAGIGFDRTASGSNAVGQYAPEVAKHFSDLATVGDDYLLWFHHLPWEYHMGSGQTLWEALVARYDKGVDEVREMRRSWDRVAPRVDPERRAEITAFLAIQEQEAIWWRDASIAYFQSVSKRPLPAGVAPPKHDLAYYQALKFPYAPGRGE